MGINSEFIPGTRLKQSASDNMHHRPQESKSDGGSSALPNSEDTSKIGVHVSREALLLINRTSRFLTSGTRKRRKRIIEPLYRQLRSLRSMVPNSNRSARSSLITDTLNYLAQMRKQIEDLNRSSQQASATQTDLQNERHTPHVEVTAEESRLQINVSCDKRPGLLADLLESLEGVGLVFDNVKVSCHSNLLFSALSTQVEGQLLEKAGLIEKNLLRVIQC